MKLKINGKEYTIKYTPRAEMIFEKITKSAFNLETATARYLYLYALIIACNPDSDLKFEELIDAIEEDPNIYLQYTEFLLGSFPAGKDKNKED